MVDSDVRKTQASEVLKVSRNEPIWVSITREDNSSLFNYSLRTSIYPVTFADYYVMWSCVIAIIHDLVVLGIFFFLVTVYQYLS